MHQFKTGGYCANCLKTKDECDCLQQQLISEVKASMTQNAMLADSLPLAEMCSFVEWIVTNDEWQYSSTAELWMQDGWRSRTTLELYELYKRQISR